MAKKIEETSIEDLFASAQAPEKKGQSNMPIIEGFENQVDRLIMFKKAGITVESLVKGEFSSIRDKAIEKYEEEGKSDNYVSSVYFRGSDDQCICVTIPAKFSALDMGQKDKLIEAIAGGPRQEGEPEENFTKRLAEANEKFSEIANCNPEIKMSVVDYNTVKLIDVMLKLASSFSTDLPEDYDGRTLRHYKDTIELVRSLVAAGAQTQFAKIFSVSKPKINLENAIVAREQFKNPYLRDLLKDKQTAASFTAAESVLAGVDKFRAIAEVSKNLEPDVVLEVKSKATA